MVGAIQQANTSAMMTDLSGQHPPSSQPLEDLACGYWSSDTFFAALELNIFGALGENTLSVVELAQASHCHPVRLSRLLTALARLNLIQKKNEGWRNLPEAVRHLIPGRPEYLGDFLLYRRYLQPTWQTLAQTISCAPLSPPLCRDDDYPRRNRYYVRALDQLARLKAKEIISELCHIPWHGPVLDIGGGAGALSRSLTREHLPQAIQATLFDLPEVLAAAQALYPEPDNWTNIVALPGEFLSHPFASKNQFGLIILSNLLHIYDEPDAIRCVNKALTLLEPAGSLLIHDYFPDRDALKGPLYDLNMMVNTPKGRCHQARDLITWLAAAGLSKAQIVDLPSDSTIIIAQGPSS